MSKPPALTPLTSSMLSGMHYEPNSRALTVKYVNGDTWTYSDVGADKAEALAGAKSPGSFFNAKVKGLHAGKKL